MARLPATNCTQCRRLIPSGSWWNHVCEDGGTYCETCWRLFRINFFTNARASNFASTMPHATSEPVSSARATRELVGSARMVEMTHSEFLVAAAAAKRRLPHIPEPPRPPLMICDGFLDPIETESVDSELPREKSVASGSTSSNCTPPSARDLPSTRLGVPIPAIPSCNSIPILAAPSGNSIPSFEVPIPSFEVPPGTSIPKFAVRPDTPDPMLAVPSGTSAPTPHAVPLGTSVPTPAASSGSSVPTLSMPSSNSTFAIPSRTCAPTPYASAVPPLENRFGIASQGDSSPDSSVQDTDEYALERLASLGFERKLVLAAYLACDRNEEETATRLAEKAVRARRTEKHASLVQELLDSPEFLDLAGTLLERPHMIEHVVQSLAISHPAHAEAIRNDRDTFLLRVSSWWDAQQSRRESRNRNLLIFERFTHDRLWPEVARIVVQHPEFISDLVQALSISHPDVSRAIASERHHFLILAREAAHSLTGERGRSG